MGRFKYTKSEREALKVLKMQEQLLQRTQIGIEQIKEESLQTKEDLANLMARAEVLLKSQGVSLPIKKNVPINTPKLKVSVSDIPSWDECVNLANKEVQGEVEFEDLLSKEEFNFCIEEIERINAEFSAKTGIINKKDLSFLAIATALQTTRWIIIQRLLGDLGETIDNTTRLAHNDSRIKKKIYNSNKKFQSQFQDHGHRKSLKSYRSWEEIIFSSAPYDTAEASPKFGENLEGRYHRYKTLGHDPVLGWIFGTANFITDTCTLSNFNSYRISREKTPHFSEPVSLFTIFHELLDSVKEDWLRLPAGIFAQFVHLRSDVFTKLGLPVPLLEVFSETLAGNLYKSQYDSLCLLKDLKIIRNQAGFSILINMIIGLIHGLFYNPEKDGERDMYEVRTRKILCISNALSSAGNLAYVIGQNDWKGIDAGGLLVNLYRLFSDVRFITRIKESFIQQQMNKVLEKELKELDSYFT